MAPTNRTYPLGADVLHDGAIYVGVGQRCVRRVPIAKPRAQGIGRHTQHRFGKFQYSGNLNGVIVVPARAIGLGAVNFTGSAHTFYGVDAKRMRDEVLLG